MGVFRAVDATSRGPLALYRVWSCGGCCWRRHQNFILTYVFDLEKIGHIIVGVSISEPLEIKNLKTLKFEDP